MAKIQEGIQMFGKTGYRDGGNRGGQDRFKWDDVKEDKYRENYLGHSLKAPVGRWQKGKDLLWYTKQGKGGAMSEEERRRQELEAIKKRDQDLINQALGLAPKEQATMDTQLEPAEIKKLLARGEIERDRLDVERVEGLGAAPAKIHEHIGHKSLVERELEKMKQALATGESFEYSDKALDDVAEGEGRGESPSRKEKKRKRDDDSEEKKRKKKEKKRMKKEKKKEKKRQKEKDKQGGRQRSSSEDSEPRRRRRSRSSS